MKKIFSLFACLFMLLVVVSCEQTQVPTAPATGGTEPTVVPTGDKTLTDADLFKGLDFNMSASLDVMVWSGDGKYYEDLGHMEIAPADMTGQNVAAIYAVAKEFNKIFPNVKINLYSKPNDPDGGGVTWAEELEAFKAEHQKYPDVWASKNVVDDINKGLALNLSEFSNTPYYQMMNPSLLNLTNYYGFQGGLPQYILPWGVYVNRELAETNNIKAPDPDWSWAQYTKFVSSAKPADGVYGSWDSGMQLVRWATVEEQIQNGSVENGYIDIDTVEFKNAIKMLPTQAKTAVNSLFGLGELTADDMIELGNYWGYQAFVDGDLLTYYGDPWMLGTSNVPGTTNYVKSGDWDIYPAPSVTGDNFVSAVLDPVCVYNYYGENHANPSSNLKTKALLAFSFASFWTADTRSWTARANQQYNSGDGTLTSCLNDSFPIVTGEEFDKQMELWYSTPGHAPYKDAERFPGFAYVCELWDEGHIRAASDKAYPLYAVDETGTTLDCLFYLTQFGNPDIVGATIADGDVWVNTYIANIPDNNKKMNDYFEIAFTNLKKSLKQYYGFTDEQLK